MSDESLRGVGARPARRAGGQTATDYKLFICVQCGFEYDEAKGWPEDGIAPGTRWMTSPTTGAARTAARRSPTSRWWR